MSNVQLVTKALTLHCCICAAKVEMTNANIPVEVFEEVVNQFKDEHSNCTKNKKVK